MTNQEYYEMLCDKARKYDELVKRLNKLYALMTCMKCEVSEKPCDDKCLTQYDAGNMSKIIENLKEIAKALEIVKFLESEKV